MNVLFLDIDGVLNSETYFDKENVIKSTVLWPQNHVDPEAISILNKLFVEIDVKVVLSSSWRELTPFEDIYDVFISNGYKGPRFLGGTPMLPYMYSRSEEIKDWLRGDLGKHTTKFVILDDKEEAGIEGHFVLVDPKIGLTEANIDSVITFLR